MSRVTARTTLWSTGFSEACVLGSFAHPGLRVAFAAVQDSHIVLQLGVLAGFVNRMTCGAIEVPPMCAAS